MKKILINRRIEEDFYIEQALAAMHNVSHNTQSVKKADIQDDIGQPRPERNKYEVKSAVVQPPLPPYPPPPDSPPKIPEPIKQEKEDPDWECNTEEQNPNNNVCVERMNNSAQPENNQCTEGKIMCKKFVRGNCNIPDCKFVHEIIVSQLPGVYKFCWQFQNGGCRFQNCQYVHASVFEQAKFLRTGELSKDATTHLKAPSQEQLDSSSFSNSSLNSGDRPMPIISCVPTSNLETRPIEIPKLAAAVVPVSPLARNTSPLKRDWNEIDNADGSPRDIAYSENERLAKKCKKCELTEIRLQVNKAKVMHSMESHNTKMSLFNKKSSKLKSVLLTLLKPNIHSKLMQFDSEHLKDFDTLSNRLTYDENARNIVAGNLNMNGLMAKLLCSIGDQSMSADSREA